MLLVRGRFILSINTKIRSSPAYSRKKNSSCRVCRSAHKQLVNQLLAVDMDERDSRYRVQFLLQFLHVVIILVLEVSYQFNLIRKGV